MIKIRLTVQNLHASIFPLSRVTHISASYNHAAFVMENGEVFTCGDNSSFCCGHGEVRRAVFRPTCIEALKGIACNQVATGLCFTVILTRKGHVYTCGSNTHGQLGHGDSLDRPTPRRVESFEGSGNVVQVAAGASYTFAVTKDGTVHSFGPAPTSALAMEISMMNFFHGLSNHLRGEIFMSFVCLLEMNMQ